MAYMAKKGVLMKHFSSFIFLLLCSCATVPPAQVAVEPPKQDTSGMRRVLIWGTHYYIHTAKVVSGGVPLRDKSGNAISEPISVRDFCLAGIEGTAAIGGKVYDWSGQGSKQWTNCSSISSKWGLAASKAIWSPGKFAFGKGNKSNPLVPFYSVAADQTLFKFGQIIFVPKAVGLKLPNGKTHDGFFRVDDVGGAIKGNHFDFFTGFDSDFKFPFVKSSASATFEAFVQ
jgi:3D (Asp-Asp-Asp) domain-containing protein